MNMKPVPFVDVNRQNAGLRAQIECALSGVIEKGDFTLGDEVTGFEREFAAATRTDFAVGTSSGTDALTLALRAMGVGPDDEVILPANTFIATAEAVWATGATPVLADVDPETYNLDFGNVERLIGPKTKVVIPVHLYGQPADMATFMSLAEARGLKVLEDACQAHGATYQGRPVGSLGHAAAFSFYPAKNLGAFGDGGMVVTSDPDIAEGVRRARDHGQTDKYTHQNKGGCHRLATIQAAVLRVKLPYLDLWNEQRRGHAGTYRRLLAGSSVGLPQTWDNRTHVYHLFVVRVRQRDLVRQALEREGIGAGIHYPVPIHLQPAFADLGQGPGSFPVAEQAANEILSLPMFPDLSADQIVRVADVLSAVTDGTAHEAAASAGGQKARR